MSIDVHILYGEGKNELFTVGKRKIKFCDFIRMNERYDELSDNFRKKFELIKPNPYIDFKMTISGVDWHPEYRSTWGYAGGDPGESAGYDDFELDEFVIGEDGDGEIFDTFRNVNIPMTERDKSIINDIFLGEKLYPTENAPFSYVKIDENGLYDLAVDDQFQERGFGKWVSYKDLEELNNDPPEFI